VARGDRGAGPCPAGGVPTVSWSTVTWTRRAGAVRRCSDRGALGADGRGPVAVRVGRERSGARGPAREENGVASHMNSNI
jgi:hypothetical protein